MHRDEEPVAAAAEMEPGLLLDHHRQLVGQLRERRGLEHLAAERADGQLDTGPGAELGRPRPGGDHEQLRVEVLRRRVVAHLDAELLRAAEQLARDGGRIAEAVGPAARRAEHVARVEPGDPRGVDALDGDAELVLEHAALLEAREPVLGRGEEEVADLAEVARPERGEELDALPGEHDLGGRRELLAHAAQRPRRRAAAELAALRDDDVVGSEQGEVVRDARADRAAAGDDYASHARTISATAVRSSSSRPRSGARTPGRIGTPRSASAVFEAAWNGRPLERRRAGRPRVPLPRPTAPARAARPRRGSSPRARRRRRRRPGRARAG